MVELDPENLDSLKVVELRAELKRRRLPATGKKAELVDRLKESLLEEQQGGDNAPEESGSEQEETLAEKGAEESTATELEPAADPAPEASTNKEDDTPDATDTLDVQVEAQPKDRLTSTDDAPSEQPETEVPKDEPAAMDVDEPKPAHTQTEPSALPEALAESATDTESARLDTTQKTDDPQPPADASAEDTEMTDVPIVETTTGDITTKSLDAESAPAPNTADLQPDPSTVTADKLPTPLPEDVPPQVITKTDAASTGSPSDTLKRKRRSPSPPPPSEHTSASTTHPTKDVPIVKEEPSQPSPKKPRGASPTRADPRYKDLFTREDGPVPKTEVKEEASPPPITPALHPATRALYIRNLIRPLSEPTLRRHLLSLATPSSSDSEPSAIEQFYLDSIKSHCFVLFSTISAAARVRADIHGQIWPAESGRKALWADFIPEEKLEKWIQKEKDDGQGMGRWEVRYDVPKDGGDVTVSLLRNGAVVDGPPPPSRLSLPPAPTGPRADITRDIGHDIRAGGGEKSVRELREERKREEANREAYREDGRGAGRKAKGEPVVMDLDQLFRSTRTKPKLYYLPVDKKIAEERLARRRMEVERKGRGRFFG